MTPAYAAHEKDARKQRAAADVAKRKAETALVKLHQRQSALQTGTAATEPSAVLPHPHSFRQSPAFCIAEDALLLF